MHTMIYIDETVENMPKDAIPLTENIFDDIEFLKQNNVFFWKGSLDTLVSAVSKKGIENGRLLLEILLKGVVAQWQQNQWQYYTCNAVVMYCCAGGYLKIVNKKKINF